MTTMRLLLALLTLLVAAVPSVAGDFNYISAEKLEQMLRQQLPVSIVDIQVEAEFHTAHIKGAQPSYAYPVKSAQDQAKLDALLPALKDGDTPVVIVCPRGAGGAERTQQYLAAKGIAPSRLLILEQGQAGWNSADLTVKK